MTSSLFQQDAEARLRAAGATVSNIYNAQLAIDVDCVAVASGGRMGVHQCLGFSELVSVPSHDSPAALATTWRKCQSSSCSGARCEPLVRSGLQNLTNLFLGSSQEPGPARESQARHDDPAQHAEASQINWASAVFYSLYIIICVSVALQWQLRRQAS